MKKLTSTLVGLASVAVEVGANGGAIRGENATSTRVRDIAKKNHRNNENKK